MDHAAPDPGLVDRLLAPSMLAPLAVVCALAALGLVGAIGAAWGYGLFLLCTMLLSGAAAAFATLLLSRRFDTRVLIRTASTLGLAGAWAYAFAVGALSGHYAHEALAGRVELRWMLFGPAALAALVVLDYGLYRILVAKNLPTWTRFGVHVSREGADPAAMRRTLVDDVLVHRSLRDVSGFRWFKHTMIFWGFALMFATELLAVVVRDAVPALGFVDVWEIPTHPLRLAFDFVYDFTGLMVLVGCSLALAWRIRVAGTEERKFSDTPSAAFLLLVVLSGFVVEGMRIAAVGPDPVHAASFVGSAFAHVVPASGGGGSTAYEVLWLVHVLGSCLFIAYVPTRRLVHSCATPMGRLMTSQRGLLAQKKRAVLGGLMTRRT